MYIHVTPSYYNYNSLLHCLPSLQLIVSVTDVNDNAPMFDTGETDFTVTEGAIVGSIIGVVRATDQDEGVNAEIEYRFTGVITEGT